jgi:hypothetical protein
MRILVLGGTGFARTTQLIGDRDAGGVDTRGRATATPWST